MLDKGSLLAMIEATRKPDPRHRLTDLLRDRLGDGLGLLLRLGGRSRCRRLNRLGSRSGNRRGGLRRRELRTGVDLRRLLHSGDGVLELPHADAERATDLRKPLRPEEQQGKNQKKDQVSRLKKSRSHAIDRTTAPRGSRTANFAFFDGKIVRSACARRGFGAGYDEVNRPPPRRAARADLTRELGWHCWS